MLVVQMFALGDTFDCDPNSTFLLIIHLLVITTLRIVNKKLKGSVSIKAYVNKFQIKKRLAVLIGMRQKSHVTSSQKTNDEINNIVWMITIILATIGTLPNNGRI